MYKSLLGCSAALLIALADASCECGHRTNTGEVWQYAVETDFSQLNATQWNSSRDWDIIKVAREATVTLNYTRENVVLANGTLQLTCSAYNQSAGFGILSGEIKSLRRDILYGSFRASYSVVQDSPGSVAGFFFYANDTQEIDVEIRSKMDDYTVHLGNQPSQSKDIYLPNKGALSGGMHDYRFDWVKNETRFYLDSVPAGGYDVDVPFTNGTVNLNMWGNGGTFAGPQTPTTDNVMSVAKVALYFNTSSKATDATWQKACAAAGRDTICTVDEGGLSVNRTATNSSAAYTAKSATLRKLLPIGVGACLYHF